MVGVRRDRPVGQATRHPHRALVARALADHLQDPHLVRVRDRERLAGGRVAVLRHQARHHRDRLARRLRPRQRDVDQRAVVDDPRRRLELLAPREGRLGDRELVLVHVAHHRIRHRRLGDPPEGLARVPLDDVALRPRPMTARRRVVQLAVELVRVRVVGDHGGAVGRRPLRDQHARARVGGRARQSRSQEYTGEQGRGGAEHTAMLLQPAAGVRTFRDGPRAARAQPPGRVRAARTRGHGLERRQVAPSPLQPGPRVLEPTSGPRPRRGRSGRPRGARRPPRAR